MRLEHGDEREMVHNELHNTNLLDTPPPPSVHPHHGQVYPKLWTEDDVLPLRHADHRLPGSVRGGGPHGPGLRLEAATHPHHVLPGDFPAACGELVGGFGAPTKVTFLL